MIKNITQRIMVTLAAIGITAMGIASPVEACDLKNGVSQSFNQDKHLNYLEFEIDQGLEFVLLDNNSLKNGITKDVKVTQNGRDTTYFIKDNGVVKRAYIRQAKPYKASMMSSDGFCDPRNPISKMSGDRKIEGVWWGGIMKDIGIVGYVGAATKSTTSDSQSKASVKPGNNASWVSGGWKDNGVISSVCCDVGVSGNKAAWDLR